jgi:hypothetical protein
MARIGESELSRYRSLDVSDVLPRLAEHVKADPTFVPIKDHATARWHVTAQGREYELLSLGPKFYDTRQRRGGGGAVDLAMHLLGVDFRGAVERLRMVL